MSSSDRQLRQRLDWAISRAENQAEENEAELAHLRQIRDDLTERIESAGPEPEPEPPTEPEPAPEEPEAGEAIALRDFAEPKPPGWLEGTAYGGRLSVEDGLARLTFPAGWEGGWEPGYVGFSRMPTDLRRVRVAVRTRLSPEFQGHHIASKWGFIWTGGYDDRPGGRPKIVLQLVGADQDPIRPAVWLQGVQMEDSPQSLNLTQNVGEAIVERGEWFDWEVEVLQNTLDEADGELRWWVNGQLVGEYTTGLRYTWRDEKKHFTAVTWRPVWGGRGGTIQKEQWIECSRIRISR